MNTQLYARLACLVVSGWLISACAGKPGFASPSSATPTLAPNLAAIGEIVKVVEGRATATPSFMPVVLGMVFSAGSDVRTGDESSSRLDFDDGTIIRLSANTTIHIQNINPASDPIKKLQLAFGKLYISLTGGVLEVETPAGVATVRGSFAIVQYLPGNPATPNSDLVVLDCLEGACLAQNEVVDARLGNLERIAFNRAGQVQTILTAGDVQAFVQDNPESGRVVATLTAAPPATETPTPEDTLTLTPPPPPPTDTPSPSPTASPEPPTATRVPPTLTRSPAVLPTNTLPPTASATASATATLEATRPVPTDTPASVRATDTSAPLPTDTPVPLPTDTPASLLPTDTPAGGPTRPPTPTP